ncbi:hypothetical protein M408DRAFT_308321 [Serendipita vermifera MAFF 305830]|uniref:Nephrocystin 3-like N-terminal domain-containing protein n=1 Tax=Serendipita vermifera MAFF 305830 TaxID=933852 RepID=A0A0C3B8B0_SERVB|nr:hypothetical protein M408DRAFT_308321 [Serendipita vermifera MAFF 305830]
MSNKSTRHNDPIPYFETEPGAISNFELDFLRKRLEPITNAHYQDDRGCMNGTRAQIINDAFLWATRSLSQNAPLENSNADGMLWIYGMPGIGKSAIAHSICHRFNDNKQLGGSFFCRRDDPALSDARSVLPTLIYELAGIFGPYRNRVAQALRDDPQLTPQSVGEEMFPTPLQSLEAYPPQALVLVIDALDECGGPATRRQLLGHLFKACQRN